MKWWKTTLIIVGAVILTALGIDAADTLTGSDGTLLSQVIRPNMNGCPKGMEKVENIGTLHCVDTYEASPGEECPEQDLLSIIATMRNVESSVCTPDSKAAAIPWRFVTRDHAMQLCARAGKRLPTSEEWYMLSLGLGSIDTACNVQSGEIKETGASDACISPHGAFDLVGNVWEWVSDDVIDGKYRERQLPEEGYVAQVDGSGIATVSVKNPEALFGSDYFWVAREGAFGIIRGGYYDSGSDGGIYAVHADTLPTTASIGIGFRCVK